jgi:hypothetical protein
MSDEVKRGRGRPKKSPYDLLSEQFQDAVATSTPEEINKRIAEIAKGAAANKELLKADPVVSDLKEELKNATAGYRETDKAFGQQLAFCRETLANKGKDNTGSLESQKVDQAH